MSVLNEIEDWVKAGVISEEKAEDIRNYYLQKKGPSTHRLFVVFGSLGALLLGLGIILILAHNWDEFSRTTKTVFAFLPLILGQIFCGISLFIKNDSTTWRESTSVFLFFAVGASLSLVSQIYNIPGNISSFLLTWMLLVLPLIYLMNSSISSLLYLIGITAYAVESGYWSYDLDPNYYWLLFLGILPYYYRLYRRSPASNLLTFHHWFIPISMVLSFGVVADAYGAFMFVAYMSLFGLFFLMGETPFFADQKLRNNSYKMIGSLGTLSLLLALSYDWFWSNLRKDTYDLTGVLTSPEFLASALASILASVLFVKQLKSDRLRNINPTGSLFLVFMVIFSVGLWSSLSMVLINIVVFLLGLLFILKGVKSNRLGTLNYGLLVIAALVICRFFDTDLSFVWRGILFVSVGIGFFITNIWMLKKRKANEK